MLRFIQIIINALLTLPQCVNDALTAKLTLYLEAPET